MRRAFDKSWWLLAAVIGLVAGLLWLGQPPVGKQESTLLQILPSADYRRWWSEAQQCTGRTRQLRDVKFYVVKGDHFQLKLIDGVATEVVGFYDMLHHAIYIAEPYIFDSIVVKHEMVHALGVIGHPKRYFDRCGL